MLHRLPVIARRNECRIWSFRELSRKAGIAYKTMMRAVDGEHFVSEPTVTKIARALDGASFASLGAQTRRKVLEFRSERIDPMTPTDICCHDELQHALDLDLRNDPETAVAIGQELLGTIPKDDVCSYLVTAAKVISFHCNCGEYARA
jgi:hypothetical protein